MPHLLLNQLHLNLCASPDQFYGIAFFSHHISCNSLCVVNTTTKEMRKQGTNHDIFNPNKQAFMGWPCTLIQECEEIRPERSTRTLLVPGLLQATAFSHLEDLQDQK